MGADTGEVVAEGSLRTTGGLLGTKDMPCHVVVTANHLSVETSAGKQTLRFAEVTGTKRAEFRLKPWGPPTVQLAVEKATSNQFGPNLILLRTGKEGRDQALAVFGAIESLATARQGAAAPADTDPADLVRRLAALRDEGLLTEDEFQAKKRAVLGLE